MSGAQAGNRSAVEREWGGVGMGVADVGRVQSGADRFRMEIAQWWVRRADWGWTWPGGGGDGQVRSGSGLMGTLETCPYMVGRCRGLDRLVRLDWL